LPNQKEFHIFVIYILFRR